MRRYIVFFRAVYPAKWHNKDETASVVAQNSEEAKTLALNARWYDGKSPLDCGAEVYAVRSYELSTAESYHIREPKFEKWFTPAQNILL